MNTNNALLGNTPSTGFGKLTAGVIGATAVLALVATLRYASAADDVATPIASAAPLASPAPVAAPVATPAPAPVVTAARATAPAATRAPSRSRSKTQKTQKTRPESSEAGVYEYY
jgi:hypothetical protein